MRQLIALALAGAALAGPAAAETFTLNYTTFNDGVNAPVTTTATITAEADPYTAGEYYVDDLVGTRAGQAITSFDNNSEFYYPAVVPVGYQFSTYLDEAFAQIVFDVGGISYDLYRGPGDSTFYHEYDGSTGRLIGAGAFSITEVTPPAGGVPEPASWALMITGFGAVGATLRRNRRLLAA